MFRENLHRIESLCWTSVKILYIIYHIRKKNKRPRSGHLFFADMIATKSESSNAAADARSAAGFWSYPEQEKQAAAKRRHNLKKDKPYDRTVYQSLTMIMQFGINMVVPIAMMTALGIWLDRKFETGYLTILFFGIGAVAGGQNIYRMARRIYSTPDKRSKTENRKGDSKGL